jgi:hypothetical protein
MKIDLLRGGQGWKLVDLDADRPVELWLWANDSAGEYEVCATDDHGRVLLTADGLNVRKETRSGRILLVPPEADQPLIVDARAAHFVGAAVG